MDTIAKSKRVTLTFTRSGETVLRGDAVAIQAMTDNVIDKRCEVFASRRLGRCIRVDGSQREITFLVDDDGRGIDEADREKVFERFSRVAGAATEGSGLGLAIVKRAVATQMGSVSLTESPAGGLRVLIALPRKRQLGA